jgi:hypothetical protein
VHPCTPAWTECAAPLHDEHHLHGGRTECAAPPEEHHLRSGMDDSCTRRSIPARRHGRSVQRHYQVHPEVEWLLLCSSGGVVPEWWVL